MISEGFLRDFFHMRQREAHEFQRSLASGENVSNGEQPCDIEIMRKVVELTQGWPAAANVQHVRELVAKAHALGFDVVRKSC